MLNDEAFLDFVLAGAPRCGTSWLFRALNEHPRIWIPEKKELEFFNYREPYLGKVRYEYARGIEAYRQHFAGAPDDRLLGDITPSYYADLTAAHRIHRHFPNVKILFLIRNPAEVAYRNYLMVSQYHRTAATFEAELRRNPHFLLVGFYHRLLTPYFDLFPREQIYVGIYERFFADPEEHCKSVFDFLGVDPTFRPTVLDRRVNATRRIKYRSLVTLNDLAGRALDSLPARPLKSLLGRFSSLHRIRENIFFRWNLEKGASPVLADETRDRLLDQYAPDMARLEGLLGVDLDCWRKTRRHEDVRASELRSVSQST